VASGVPVVDLVATGLRAWAGPRAVLAVGASFSHRAQGGGIWPDGGGMPDHQPQALPQPTRHLSRLGPAA
jgi:hypothetical protein